ncbi:hypothetical protein [Pedomonas sp. V897]|uniref:hypothetical protein n=1 Tax=Pedomonas sp. V897 TaxID=3446482 RepID=UPI003EE12CDD
MDAERVAKLLGWFSIGLGVAEIVSNRTIARALGIGADKHELVKSFGIREIANGVGLLSTPRPARWMWTRVIGDATDLAALMPALQVENPRRRWATYAFAGVLALTVADILCARQLARPASGDGPA